MAQMIESTPPASAAWPRHSSDGALDASTEHTPQSAITGSEETP
jgi:hypothetical protein